MGRPLKIKKTATSDIGFPNNGSNGFDITKPGVVGGAGTLTNVAKIRVKLPGVLEKDGYIVRQKGKRKFQVETEDINGEDIKEGGWYKITALGNTDWASVGATSAAVGTIFYSTADGSGTQTGTARGVGSATLANTNDGSLADGTLTVTFTNSAAGTGRLATLTNHWGTDFADPANKYLLTFNGTAAAGATAGTAYAEVKIEYWS